MAIVARNAPGIQDGMFAEAQRVHERNLEMMTVKHRLGEDGTMRALAEQAEHDSLKLRAATANAELSGLKRGIAMGWIGGMMTVLALQSFGML